MNKSAACDLRTLRLLRTLYTVAACLRRNAHTQRKKSNKYIDVIVMHQIRNLIVCRGGLHMMR